MRKLKRFFAVLLSAALLCPMTAYADNSEDAKALYRQVNEQQKSITDMNAFADFKISIGGSILKDTGMDAMNMRMEMNMKMNHMTEPQQMRYMMYSRTTMEGMEEPMIISAYYQDGCYYQDSMGQKVKMPMDMGTMMEQSMASVMAFEDDFEEYLSNFRLWDEGENKVVGFVMEADQMDEYFQMVLGSTGMSGLLDTTGLTLGDVIYEYVVDPAGNCIKMRMKMDMAMEAEGETITMKLDGDIGIADPGQPVEVPAVPDPQAYQDFEALMAEAAEQAEQQ